MLLLIDFVQNRMVRLMRKYKQHNEETIIPPRTYYILVVKVVLVYSIILKEIRKEHIIWQNMQHITRR
ncbi:MAG: hypothetical protein NVSMB54_02190 [Ktedonobacteraceae bacterium]